MSRVIVITGASEGIGALLAKRRAAEGDSIALAARRQGQLQRVAQQCGSATLTVATDVTKRAQIERLRDAALERFGHIDVWINNAGRGIGIRVMDFTEEDFDEMLAVNLKSAWYAMKAIIPSCFTRPARPGLDAVSQQRAGRHANRTRYGNAIGGASRPGDRAGH